jgi:hypothetical protein
MNRNEDYVEEGLIVAEHENVNILDWGWMDYTVAEPKQRRPQLNS